MVTAAAIEGWFTFGDEAALLGGRCRGCGTFTFPHTDGRCPNPHCTSTEQELVELSRRGTLWSHATNHYPAPPPAVVAAPYTVVAVTLEAEQLTVLGLLSEGDDATALRVGSPMVLVVEDLTTDEDGTVRSVWKWRLETGS